MGKKSQKCYAPQRASSQSVSRLSFKSPGVLSSPPTGTVQSAGFLLRQPTQNGSALRSPSLLPTYVSPTSAGDVTARPFFSSRPDLLTDLGRSPAGGSSSNAVSGTRLLTSAGPSLAGPTSGLSRSKGLSASLSSLFQGIGRSRKSSKDSDYRAGTKLNYGIAYHNPDAAELRVQLRQMQQRQIQSMTTRLRLVRALCHIEAQVEYMSGTLKCLVLGISGFSRLCAGDLFEVHMRYAVPEIQVDQNNYDWLELASRQLRQSKASTTSSGASAANSGAVRRSQLMTVDKWRICGRILSPREARVRSNEGSLYRASRRSTPPTRPRV
ncbi:unnamed protein product [Protopolystoma xenopodis]|uniref:Uncharacterized protein n=1 Tax=Protopolystoma xenopodis TaxID=117903 RepID=A0A3S4ZUP4_9PLAT|nr:unnamed protein product [Protopolystoma xenopodis]